MPSKEPGEGSRKENLKIKSTNMSVSTHLSSVASSAILTSDEKSSIATSISTLSSRLTAHFGAEVVGQFQFGSSTRGTILPRWMDSSSDIDYLIQFDDETLKPQTYISKLKVFCERYYSSSQIKQSSPTMVLSLNHITFDLVPAIGTYQIPAPASSYTDWVSTYPFGFAAELTEANKKAGNNLKPAIRLLKYWNCRAGYVFTSYSLEKWAAAQYLWNHATVKDCFFSLIEGVDLSWDAAQWKKDKLQRAKDIVIEAKRLESIDCPTLAEQEIKNLIP